MADTPALLPPAPADLSPLVTPPEPASAAPPADPDKPAADGAAAAVEAQPQQLIKPAAPADLPKEVLSQAAARYPSVRFEVNGAYGQVDAKATEHMLLKLQGVRHLRIDFVRGLSARIFNSANLAGLKHLTLHCKMSAFPLQASSRPSLAIQSLTSPFDSLCAPAPPALPFRLEHLTLGGSYFPIALAQSLLTTSSGTLRHLALTLQTHHSESLRDEILRHLPTLIALESLTDWTRSPEDTATRLLPALPRSLRVFETGFDDKIRIPAFIRSLLLPAVPNLEILRFMYLAETDFSFTPEGSAFMAALKQRGIKVEFGFERKDLREEHLLTKTEALRAWA
ncbi:hypothetical protein JCM10207_004622 [Rhodosporidiobolus poonsookiae]